MEPLSRGVFIIAEAGVNHNGDLDLARRLVVAAKKAGADAVKFQTFKAAALVTRDAAKARYQEATTEAAESQKAMLQRLELSEADHVALLACCRQEGIRFLSSAFDLESLALLQRLGLDPLKLPSGELTNLPYLRRVGAMGRRLIVSTGMASLGEVEAALDVLEKAGTSRDKITLLHCTTSYPTPPESVNLQAMATLAAAFGTAVGYSDHTEGIAVSIAAVALGAVVIEKHFTLDRTLPGPDHQASIEPEELAALVRGIRMVERARGDGIKRPAAAEVDNTPVARKSIVAARGIRCGEVLSDENLTVKRPGTGISPMCWDQVCGRVAGRDYREDEFI
ncbi:MAG: N-acetylneuraminate synthase, partial [Magnetococcales bacterium]|nr:N-acetylneuraminate synthase [Magnetococcales bacterium]